MSKSPAERAKEYRDRKRGKPAREPAACGSMAAYRRHKEHGEPIDDACREVYNAKHREYYANRQARAALARAKAARARGATKKRRRQSAG